MSHCESIARTMASAMHETSNHLEDDLRGNLPNDCNQESPAIEGTTFATHCGRITKPRDSRNEKQRPCWENGCPIVCQFKCNAMTVSVPRLAPHVASADIKQQTCTATANNVERSSATWSDKADGLAHLFINEVPGATTTASTAMA